MNVEPWSTVGLGAGGSVVPGLQYLLRVKGHPVAVDGSFGPATTAAVTALQSAVGLPANGIVGPHTWLQLFTATAPKSSGDAVRAVQQFGLPRWPEDEVLVVDGAYGPSTTERVRTFQESWGLSLDGMAGSETWSFLSTFTPGPQPWPLVKVGASQETNWRVLAAQHLLRAHGSAIAADGHFGPASGAAVNAFQQAQRATEISTTIGQLDWPALTVTVHKGDSGEAVRAVQTLLQDGTAVDGAFGPLTEAAVRNLQTMFGPPADGIVGPKTWQMLAVDKFE